jgi:hypothetical protein
MRAYYGARINPYNTGAVPPVRGECGGAISCLRYVHIRIGVVYTPLDSTPARLISPIPPRRLGFWLPSSWFARRALLPPEL